MSGDKTPLHVLFVEDVEVTRTIFAAILRKAGYEVSVARNGREALGMITSARETSGKIDILVTDIWMDDLDGLRLMEKLEQLRMSIPTLAMTGNTNDSLQDELARRGCSNFIEKPFGAAELLESLEKTIMERTSDGARAG